MAHTGIGHGHMDHTEMAGADAANAYFSTDAAGLPVATAPQVVELRDGDVFDLHITSVAKRVGDATVRMLAYNGSIPGPTLRVAQGLEITVRVRNDADVETTVHWHGLRLENRYDGTPHETQAPIPIGGEFTYRVHFPDAGSTGTTRTSARTTLRRWACMARSWSRRPTRRTGRPPTAR